MKTGWSVYLQFGIVLHKKDRLLLESIKTFFGNVGNITEGNQKVQYRVSSIKDLEVIIEHFDNFPLITQKWSDYQLFKSAFELVKCKNHLTQEGLEKIVSIKASFNWGLSDDLKLAFWPHVTHEARPLIQNQEIKDPNWLAGFVDAFRLRIHFTSHSFFFSLYRVKTWTLYSLLAVFMWFYHGS